MRTSGLIAASLLASFAPSIAAAQAQQPRAPGQTPAARPAAPARPAGQAPVARPAQPQGLRVPQASGLMILIRSSLTALNQANLTGNYSVLHALGSDTMRANTNPQALAQAFAGFRQRNVDISPVLILNPQLSQQPMITGGRLHLVGRFPSQPLAIGFDMWFEISQNRWKLVQLNANLAPIPAQGQAQPPRQGQPQQPRQQGQQPQQAPRRR